jgi:hypothetical protein
MGIDGELPAHLASLPWGPSQSDKNAAWVLYNELRSRIATQALPYAAGDEERALTSVYELFPLTRSLIKDQPEARHFATLALHVLNLRVRPFTAKWHKVSVAGRLSNADVRFEFRRELANLQGYLRQLCTLLGHLAGDFPAVAEQCRAPLAESPKVNQYWGDLEFGVCDNEAMRASEQAEVLNRRQRYALANSTEATNAVGLAISGGGIRSATFALGVVQSLARMGIARHIDYLSTVSGGGYLGSFISSALDDSADSVTLNPNPNARPFGASGTVESDEVRHLRQHGKYLSEGGLLTQATVVWQLMYGALISALLLSPFLALLVLCAGYFKPTFTRAVTGHFTPDWLTWGGALLIVGTMGIMSFVPSVTRARRVQAIERIAATISMCAFLVIAAQVLPYVCAAILANVRGAHLMGASLAFPATVGLLATLMPPSRKARRWVLNLLMLSGPFFIGASFLWLTEMYIFPADASLMPLVYFLSLTVLITTAIININFASPRRYYRDRLARAYLRRSDHNSTDDSPLLSQMHSEGKSPYHLICAALNIPASVDVRLLGRGTDFFLFSKHFCGSPATGYHPTKDWETYDRHLDLATAISISGAAAAPNMGTLSSPRLRFLLAMFNIRLGYWARRPDRGWSRLKWLPPWGPLYFFRELSGRIDEHAQFLNLSDGGHIENLGIYELLKRKCKFIIAIDGEADPTLSFGGLIRLVQLAHVDLGVRIAPDLSDLRRNADGHGMAHFSMARIDYPGENQHGFLLYIKSSLTGNESEFLKLFRAEHPDFPHQSTAQQLFSEMQFEAYRALGEHIGQDLFRQDLVQTWDTSSDASIWFKRLSEHLL